jgi:hypothetical protein
VTNPQEKLESCFGQVAFVPKIDEAPLRPLKKIAFYRSRIKLTIVKALEEGGTHRVVD